MQHDQIVSFLLALAVLLSTAAFLGRVAQRCGVPSIVGDLSAGILLGKTILGRLAPDAYTWLFAHPENGAMLQGYKTISIVLLLLLAGLEINLLSLRRFAGVLVYTSVLGAAIPFVGGYAVGMALPDGYLIDPQQREVFAVFLGIALSISALPVITRTLMDLGLLKTKIGAVVLSAAVVNDLVGWLCFGALVRAMGSASEHGSGSVLRGLMVTTGCLVLALVVARPLAARWLGAATQGAAPRATSRGLAVVVAAAFLGSAGAELLGIHAVFGGLLVGLALGGSTDSNARLHHTLHDCVNNLFSPVFFAMMALNYDVVAALDLGLVAVVIGAACASKIIGCAVGARLGGFDWSSSLAVGLGMNSRGAMEILLASVALDTGIIEQRMFVALILMAICTSVISGPAMSRVLKLGRVAAT